MRSEAEFVILTCCPIYSRYAERLISLYSVIKGPELSLNKVSQAYELLKILDKLTVCRGLENEKKDCPECRHFAKFGGEAARIILDANRSDPLFIPLLDGKA